MWTETQIAQSLGNTFSRFVSHGSSTRVVTESREDPDAVDSINILAPAYRGNISADDIRLRMRDVLLATARTCGVSPREIKSEFRHRIIMRARFICAFICRHYCFRSYPHIGLYMGRRHHTTIMNAVVGVEDDYATYRPEILAVLESLNVEERNFTKRDGSVAP